MGIRRLTTRLAHKSEDIWLSDHSELPRSAIIDGPSLAYYIYNKAIKDPEYDARPYAHAYDVLVADYVAFLDRLTELGFTIEHIYFDGGLPESKVKTRIHRMQQYLEQVQAIEQACKDGARRQHKKSADWETAFSKAISKTAYMPSPTNMIAIIVEGLLTSRYGDITKVVPGEADGWLAASAQELSTRPGDIFILSDDSDMLVYPMDENVKILMLSSFMIYDDIAKATIYCSAQIALSLGVDNLLQVAYMMEQHHFCSLESASSKALSLRVTQTPEFLDFARQYSLPDGSELQVGPRQELVFQCMDPIVAEVVQQVRAGSNTASPLQVYYKTTMDDPAQKSAWRVSQDIRSLAYSILLAQHNHGVCVHEHDRKGTMIGVCKVPVVKDPTERLEVFVEWLHDMMSTLQNTEDPCMLWRVISMAFIMGSHQQASDLPTQNTIHQVITNDWPKSWTDLHLQAQLDTTISSLKMLKLISVYVIAGYHDRNQHQHIPPSLLRLQDLLESFPSFKIILTVEKSMFTAELRNEIRTIMDHVIAQLDADDTTSTASTSDESGNENDVDEMAERATSNNHALQRNPFAMLSTV